MFTGPDGPIPAGAAVPGTAFPLLCGDDLEALWRRRPAGIHQINEATRAQERGEVCDRAVDLQGLVVERREKFGGRHFLAPGDLVQENPERSFKLDAGGMPANAYRTVDRPVPVWILPRIDLTHLFPPFLFFFCLTMPKR